MNTDAGRPPGGERELTFLGLRFATLDLGSAVAWVREHLGAPRFGFMVTPNVDHIVRFHRAGALPWHPAFVAAVAAADVRVNDSRILAALASRSGIALPTVPGSDLTRMLMEEGLPAGVKVALVGGGTGEADWLQTRLPMSSVVHFDPPHGVLHSPAAQAEIVAFVETERPHLTLLAIGAPQSEIIAHQLQCRGQAIGVGLCIGASIEFLTGAKRRAPVALQKLGLEWAFRLLSEPRRMWRRYLVEGPRIFVIWRDWRRARSGSRALEYRANPNMAAERAVEARRDETGCG
jgi:exopolysaccharide biosynthesis WecB/TagA/CpsF family protein